MSKSISIIDKDYKQWVKALILRYRQNQIKAAVKVNQEVLRFYWELGKDIVERDAENHYGSRFYPSLSRDLKEALQTDGFSERNLRYMKSFYLLYNEQIVNLPQLWQILKKQYCHRLWQNCLWCHGAIIAILSISVHPTQIRPCSLYIKL